MRDVTRTPVIPLDFKDQPRSVNSEILIDYDKGEIYAVDKVNKNKLINLTNRIKNEVFNYLDTLQGSQMTDITHTYVTIEDFGRVNVAEFLKLISVQGIDGYPVVEDSPVALRRLRYDNASILVYTDKIAVAGFDEAGNDYIPVKKDGTIRWIPTSNLPTSEGYTPNKYDINDIPIVDNIVKLSDNPVQKTLNIYRLVSLKLPNTINTNYCIIRWITSLEDISDSGIVFDDRIIWRYESDNITVKNNIYVYEFETFDSGETWYGSRYSYDNKFSNDPITKEEIYSNYFSKQDMIDLMSWEDMDEEAMLYENEHGKSITTNPIINNLL